MSEDIKEMYRCGECDSLHDDEWWAEECCPVTISSVYICIECDSYYESHKEAEDCCASPQTIYRINQRRLEEAGQMRLFP